ncbi:MAG: alpha/beta hydrolase [bacterium]|nr:alpha/beta hydrolase [bacterium]
MTKRAFIIHGWDGSPEEGWFPWLKGELETRGFSVIIPAMPDPRHPVIEAWVSHIHSAVGTPDEQTFLIGHSIGAQAVIRYLQELEADQKIGGAIFVAGWVTLTPAAYEQEGDEKTAQPWLETPINWEKVKSHAAHVTAICSDDDPFVPRADAEVFREQIGAEVIIEQGKGHFGGDDGITELPSVRNAILKYAETR